MTISKRTFLGPSKSAASNAPRASSRPTRPSTPQATWPSRPSERAHGLDELYAVAEEESRRVVQRQIDIGLDVVSDGEFRRYMFLNSLFDGITGFSSEVSKARFKAADGSVIEWNMQYVVDRLKQVDSPAAREAAFMSTVTDHLYKVTFPAGSFLALPYNYKAEINGHAYDSHRELVEHVVAIEKRMIADVVAAGCRYVQLDFPVYPFLCDPDWRGADGAPRLRLEARPWSWRRGPIARSSPDCRTTCARASTCAAETTSRGTSRRERSIPVAEALFSLPYDSFLIEWEDKARMGDYSALRHVPPGDSVVVLGIVSSKRAALEYAGRPAARARSSSRPHRSGPARHLAAVRLRVHPQGQPRDGGRSVAKAGAGRRHGAPLLVVTRRARRVSGSVRPGFW